MFRRAVSRAAASTLRASTSASASSTRAMVQRRAAAPAFARFGSLQQVRAKSSLVELLKREVEEEKGNCLEGEDLEELHAKMNKIFKLEETAGNMEVLLVGEAKGDSICIKFDAQGAVDVEEEYDGGDDDEEEDENEPIAYDADIAGDDDDEDDDDEEDELPGIRFVAEITRDNAGLQFECVASSNLTIERVRYLGDMVKDVDNENQYYGPNFIDLELDVQEALYKYLAERHVDDELASFITQYSDLKEQREYLSFLENTLKFVKK